MPKGNPNPPIRKPHRGAELASRVRKQILDAIDILDEKGKTVSELLAERAEEDIFKFFELMSKYVPREMNHEHTGDIHQTHTHIAVSEADKRIEELLGAGQDSGTAETRTH